MAKKLGERLVEAGLVQPDAIQKALEHQRITGHKLGDCLVEIGLLQEAALLRFLAAEFQTRFVATEKLAKAKIPTEVLDKLPVRMAEAQNVLPVAYDPERKVLSVVAAEPQNKALLDEIALVTGASEVCPYVGLRSAIAASIKKHYYGDPTAFATFGQSPQSLRVDISTMAGAYESGAVGSGKGSPPSLQLRLETDGRLGSGQRTNPNLTTSSTLAKDPSRSAVADNDYVETLSIMVGLLEQSRKHHRGHSAQLARQATTVGRRMGLEPKALNCIAIAAYLHDLGKPTERHYCLASNAADPDWKAEAKRYYRTPTRLFETVHLPGQVNTILAQLYEAYDGSGTPQGTKGEDIDVGARILAAVDSMLELTRNPTNAYGRLFNKEQALAHLRENAGKLYDPAVADIVAQVQSGELLRQRLVHDGRQVLVVAQEEALRTDLLESVQRQELVAYALATLEGAYDALLNRECDVLVVGLDLGLQELLALLQAVRSTPEHAGLPVVVVGKPDAQSRERLLTGGASAVVSPDELEQTGRAVREQYDSRVQHNGPARVVKGSLDEIPWLELLKLLGSRRKSGRLNLKQGSHEGLLYVERGRVVSAVIAGQSGDAALQSMLGLKQADFQYDADELLLDVPQMDRDLEVLVRQLSGRKPSPAAGGSAGPTPLPQPPPPPRA